MKINHNWINTLLIVVVGIMVWVGGNQPLALSGLTNYDEVGTTEGYKVDGTTVIDGSGNWVGSGTLTGSDLTLTGVATAIARSYGNSGLSTTTDAAGTFTAAQICDNDRIIATPNIGNVTLTVASSSSMFADCIPDPGDFREVFFQNASSTGTAAITLADQGINTEHIEAEGGTTIIDVAEFGYLTFRNLDDTTMIFEVEIRQAAD